MVPSAAVWTWTLTLIMRENTLGAFVFQRGQGNRGFEPRARRQNRLSSLKGAPVSSLLSDRRHLSTLDLRVFRPPMRGLSAASLKVLRPPSQSPTALYKAFRDWPICSLCPKLGTELFLYRACSYACCLHGRTSCRLLHSSASS